jgi:anthranilate phosphoribosyltransferase
MALLEYLHRAVAGQQLDAAAAEQAMRVILSGGATEAQIAGFLVALRMRGETATELAGFARALRARASRVDAGVPGLLDTCGTGGDGLATFNISTLTALVVAAAGVPVAKHGNRSMSSHCGSADILEALGVNVSIGPEGMARCIRECGFGFLFAPALHPAMKYAGPVRRDLKMRTVFNLLGPLANPAGAEYQLIGAPSVEAARLMAGALAELGTRRACIVHGDGLDEVTTTGSTTVFELEGGAVRQWTVQPEDFGVPRASIKDLRAPTKEDNVRVARAVLAAERGPCRDIVLVNAAMALRVAGHCEDLPAGVARAGSALDRGAARAKLEALVALTSELPVGVY